MKQPPTLTMPDGTRWPVSEELVEELEAAVRAWRRQNRDVRDLPAEIEAFLRERHLASALEIARGIRARDHLVRRTLNNDPRFLGPYKGPKGASRARRWMLAPSAEERVPASTGARGSR